ncbi:MAG: nucleoside diphosphate kinase regulator [Breznakibacter sp.]|nr:nucleoside diphosphate kinase regulator [Breznakibacter sp.]
MNSVIMSRLDYQRIQDCINKARKTPSAGMGDVQKLAGELKIAKVVEPQEVPADVVTMNSEVKISFLNNNNTVKFKIVYPDEACMRENRISIFSPIATALLGYRTGMEVEWMVPAGLTKIRIDEILYQPEAAGNYTL